ncbi:hypothetical protein TNCV_1528811 [Trichonephila clavipes]|nr:hypothetical protein TNCV_1528811 [Trichonephila clavipes]
MARWARRPECVLGCYAQIGRGKPRDFCDLPIRRDEGRVVNTPLVFKRVLFQETKKKEKKEEKETGEREETEKEKKRVGSKREAGLGWRKGLSPVFFKPQFWRVTTGIICVTTHQHFDTNGGKRVLQNSHRRASTPPPISSV